MKVVYLKFLLWGYLTELCLYIFLVILSEYICLDGCASGQMNVDACLRIGLIVAIKFCFLGRNVWFQRPYKKVCEKIINNDKKVKQIEGSSID